MNEERADPRKHRSSPLMVAELCGSILGITFGMILGIIGIGILSGGGDE